MGLTISSILDKNEKYDKYFRQKLGNDNDDICGTYTSIIYRMFDHLLWSINGGIGGSLSNLKFIKEKDILPTYPDEITFMLKLVLNKEEFWNMAEAYQLLIWDMTDELIIPTNYGKDRYGIVKFYADLENKIKLIEKRIPDTVIKSFDEDTQYIYEKCLSEKSDSRYGDFEILLNFFDNPLYWIEIIYQCYVEDTKTKNKSGKEPVFEKDAPIKLWEEITQLKCSYDSYIPEKMSGCKFWESYFGIKEK